MVDFHSHLLPGMDDGSLNEDESISMLEESAEQGVKIMAATSHFYATAESPEDFLSRRAESMRVLMNMCDEKNCNRPRILAGAEVSYFDGISGIEQLGELCIEDTNLILIEMPFSKWTERALDEICSVRERRGVIPLIAHIERYLSFQNKRKVLGRLIGSGVLIQANADFFICRRTSGTAMRMLQDGVIHLLGSDCHNMGTRRPNLGEAVSKIEKKLGNDAMEKIFSMEQTLIGENAGTAVGLK